MDSKTLTITAVGDIMLGDNPHHLGRGVATKWKHRSLTDQLKHLKPFFSSDLVIGNLECTLGNIASKNPLRRAFVAPSSRANELKELGFTHLSIANNHILEHGAPKAIDTKMALERAGLTACGDANPIGQRINGAEFAVFSYSLAADPKNKNFYKNEIDDNDFQSIKSSSADYKIVLVHWGDEYSFYPSKRQIKLAHQLIECGVTLVLGHHPHVIQGIEFKDGALVAYSLGNFIFDQNWSLETRTGLILKTELKNGRVSDFSTQLTRQGKDFVPIPTNSDQITQLNKKLYYCLEDPVKYGQHVRKRQNWARVQMKKELIRNLSNASLATLLYPFVRRSAFIERLLFEH